MKIPYRALVFVLAVCSVLSGCAGVNPGHLRRATVTSKLTLVEPFVYEEFCSILGNKFQYTLSSGEYKATYEDANGTYYSGPDKCFKIELISTASESQKGGVGKPNFHQCGIYMASNSEPKIYYFKYQMADLTATNQVAVANVANSSLAPAQAGLAAGAAMVIGSALDEAEAKNIHFFRDQPKGNSLSLAIKRQ